MGDRPGDRRDSKARRATGPCTRRRCSAGRSLRGQGRRRPADLDGDPDLDRGVNDDAGLLHPERDGSRRRHRRRSVGRARLVHVRSHRRGAPTPGATDTQTGGRCSRPMGSCCTGECSSTATSASSPFRRTGGPIPIDEEVEVVVRAHMSVGGYGGAARFEDLLPRASRQRSWRRTSPPKWEGQPPPAGRLRLLALDARSLRPHRAARWSVAGLRDARRVQCQRELRGLRHPGLGTTASGPRGYLSR